MDQKCETCMWRGALHGYGKGKVEKLGGHFCAYLTDTGLRRRVRVRDKEMYATDIAGDPELRQIAECVSYEPRVEGHTRRRGFADE